jgi:hypothetical protein
MDRAKKGTYCNEQKGWHAFGNIDQTKSGTNGWKSVENGNDCENRYLMISATSLEGSNNLNIKIETKPFSDWPEQNNYDGYGAAMIT